MMSFSNMKKAVEPSFTNVTVNFLKKREQSFNSPQGYSRTPVIHSQKSDGLLAKRGAINRGSVTKAAFPSYVGMTPEYD